MKRRKIMPKSAKKKPERILVLCVDRDDDLGMKAGIKTPILGSKENVNAAASLALRDPEEPDANAMFEAVRIFNHLKKGAKEQEEYEVATISGSDLGGVGADRQLVAELTEVLSGFPATDVILVTDGYADEAVLPLIESRVPVTSVRRIVMKHSKSIEETAALFTRYLRILVENPRYSRILLGLPGILLIILGILAVFNWLAYAGIAFLIVFGAFLFVRGFGLDKAARNFYTWAREYSPPPYPVQIASFSAVAGVLLVLVGGYLGGAAVADVIPLIDPPSQWLSWLPRLIGEFLSDSILLIVIGICVILSGRVTRWFFERDLRLWRTIVVVVVCAWSYTMFYQASQILINPEFSYTGLVIAIIIAIPLIVTAVFAVFILRRRYAGFFIGKEKEIEEFKEG
jgi:putative membrane protein